MSLRWPSISHLVLTLSLALMLTAAAWVTLAYPPSASALPAAGVVAPCNEAGLDAALAGGGLVTFSCKTVPVTIILTNQKIITSDTTINGTNDVTLSGNNATALFYVNPSVTLTLTNLILADGYVPGGDGGAVYVSGNTLLGEYGGALVLDHATIRNSHTDFHLGSAAYAGGAVNGGSCQAGGSVISLLNGSVIENNYNAAAGAIYAGCYLNVIDSTVRANQGITGAGLFVGGSALISNSQFYSNVVADVANARGGALYIADTGDTRISNSLFASNIASGTSGFGGAVFVAGVMTATGTTFSANSVSHYGGALYITGMAALTNSMFSGNSARSGGAIHGESAAAILRLTNVSVADNFAKSGGGGIALDGAMATLMNVTLSGNHGFQFSSSGGGISNQMGTLTLTNSTLSDNAATEGGGIFNFDAKATLANVTLSGNGANQGSGLSYWNTSSSPIHTLLLKNTMIVSGTQGGNCFQGFSGGVNITSNGNNLSDDNSCAPFFTNSGALTRDWNNANANLGPLSDNGGYTLTRLPLPGSLAIDHGDACPPLDQRGVIRPQGPRCDIGAVEYQYRPGDVSPWLYLPLIRR